LVGETKLLFRPRLATTKLGFEMTLLLTSAKQLPRLYLGIRLGGEDDGGMRYFVFQFGKARIIK
jgi:hypothetical protein